MSFWSFDKKNCNGLVHYFAVLLKLVLGNYLVIIIELTFKQNLSLMAHLINVCTVLEFYD